MAQPKFERKNRIWIWLEFKFNSMKLWYLRQPKVTQLCNILPFQFALIKCIHNLWIIFMDSEYFILYLFILSNFHNYLLLNSILYFSFFLVINNNFTIIHNTQHIKNKENSIEIFYKKKVIFFLYIICLGTTTHMILLWY